jgi:acyl dehydratase
MSNQFPEEHVFYFEDLHIGQGFVSGSHLIDEKQIKEFAAQFDPQPFHLDGATGDYAHQAAHQPRGAALYRHLAFRRHQ